MNEIASMALELDKLKTVYRKSYLSDGSRNENSAEHSWHLAVVIIGFIRHLPQDVDIDKCIRMALCHDICEIGAGDVCAYHDDSSKHDRERQYMDVLSEKFSDFGSYSKGLWSEYEVGATLESQWVKVFDKLLPFVLNIANKGRTWKEQGISRSMVIAHNAFIAEIAPDIYNWMLQEVKEAEKMGWLNPD